MSHQDRDSLENFFKERAQRHNLEFNEGDWLKLEKQLDREMPVAFTFFSFLKRFWLLGLALVLIPTSWILYHSVSSQNRDLKSQTNVVDKNQSEAQIMNDASEMKTTNLQLQDEIKNKQDQLLSNRSEIDQRDENYEEQVKQFEAVSSINENISGTPMDRSENTINTADAQGNTKSENKGQVVFEEGVNTYRHKSIEKLLFLSSIPPGFIIDEEISTVYVAEEELEVISPQGRKAHFKIGLGYGPDFSTVGIGNFVPPGSRWTGQIEMGFLGRFVLNTGIVYVSNKYEAYGEDYHAPPKYWKKGIVAEEAYGYCKMIDIPLNLRYNFIHSGKNMVFVSAGASTYFVTKEDYYFEYEQEDPELPTHWGTDKTTIYPFGIINLSLGYEHVFTQKSGLQIEPFIKIPTTGIGWGNVDLHTIGVYFMYKYKL